MKTEKKNKFFTGTPYLHPENHKWQLCYNMHSENQHQSYHCVHSTLHSTHSSSFSKHGAKFKRLTTWWHYWMRFTRLHAASSGAKTGFMLLSPHMQSVVVVRTEICEHTLMCVIGEVTFQVCNFETSAELLIISFFPSEVPDFIPYLFFKRNIAPIATLSGTAVKRRSAC